ncbi:nitrogen regulatory protein P-II 2 [Candidatus Hakubella thermalkaliphila]|uniref:Nitrogen regulatory protein P-II 2 n=1 Tax=Candidatus Hakubella thermalkaliphila TaxID=2754717 RepID=A0A6V8NJV1_9ACTN|nr:transcriptional regulator [Candidatus Hakubella thermalkaliphila]MBT9171268.1 Membrane-associated protein [Actinomycetota bacterium]GFP18796.1 nitrogen regulatory protein P-II 2 [Candidatus Hakubella thermalkaliphila]GFP23540.1 hypothetical protein HKBW3S09_01006 [Candidatus Hakubella thermalkaliphila]GFP30458.1 nitrogen regulatory protein P-II 2 [Candidatus Hakubella thermalkaliphila]GFP32738.1 nitrogen regulatory protein P-II 2 [Candidatus Hakubella thermalkaliphila]
MELENATKVVIITETIIESSILRLLKSLGVKGFTIYKDITGEGGRGIRSVSGGLSELGENVRIEIIVSNEEKARLIMENVCDKYLSKYAGIIYLENVQVIRIEKFANQNPHS